MGMFDTIHCEYPLPERAHQALEFQTKDLECLLERYTLTRDGRLLRLARPGGPNPLRDIAWPRHGDVRMYASDPASETGLIEYVVRFTHGRVEWVRRLGQEDIEVAPAMEEPPPADAPVPRVAGRPLTADELAACTPAKLELIQGRVSGDEKLLLLLLAGVGLQRAAELVGPGAWRLALAPPDEPDLDRLLLRDQRAAAEHTLLRNLREREPELRARLEQASSHWGFEDPVYRFYHHSFKVYGLQEQTEAIVALLRSLWPERALHRWFEQIVRDGTGKRFRMEDNAAWTCVTRPIVEAFFHARFFLEMAVRYARLEAPPDPLPSGYAALLYLYRLR